MIIPKVVVVETRFLIKVLAREPEIVYHTLDDKINLPEGPVIRLPYDPSLPVREDLGSPQVVIVKVGENLRWANHSQGSASKIDVFPWAPWTAFPDEIARAIIVIDRGDGDAVGDCLFLDSLAQAVVGVALHNAHAQ